MADIRPESDKSVRLSFDRAEAGVLRDLIEQMRDMLRAEGLSDPVTGRLFPPAYETKQEERAYRDLVGNELKNGKLRALDAIAEALGKSGRAVAVIDHEGLERWLTALTDMRLAIGVRLDVDEERMSAPLEAGRPDAPAMAVLHWLGWVQESILAAMVGRTLDQD